MRFFSAFRLLPVSGVSPCAVALASLVALVAATPARGATPAPIPVTVTNPSVSVQPGAPKQPFAQSLPIQIAAGSTSNSTMFTIPAGMRLVVQNLSLFGMDDGTETTGSTIQGFMDASVTGVSCSLAMPISTVNGALYVGSTLSLEVVLDAGSQVTFQVYRNSVLGNQSMYITVTGYLVNAS